jgi:hypothetical protein
MRLFVSLMLSRVERDGFGTLRYALNAWKGPITFRKT